jgi:hypothetical protein
MCVCALDRFIAMVVELGTRERAAKEDGLHQAMKRALTQSGEDRKCPADIVAFLRP